jgi:hypothetical protein
MAKGPKETTTMNKTTRFHIERKDGDIKMIFPVPQRYEVKTYHRSPRRSYQTIEPVHTPWLVLPITSRTANAIVNALKESDIQASAVVHDNGDIYLTVESMEIVI